MVLCKIINCNLSAYYVCFFVSVNVKSEIKLQKENVISYHPRVSCHLIRAVGAAYPRLQALRAGIGPGREAVVHCGGEGRRGVKREGRQQSANQIQEK